MSPTLDVLLQGFARGVPPVAVSGLALDSRGLRPGQAFLAVRGSRGHGLAHLPQALQAGASAIVWEPAPTQPSPQANVPCIAVDALGLHVGEIAARWYGHPSARLFVAGITGTDGKTSTAHLLAQAFDTLGLPCAYLGTLGLGRIGALDEATHTTPDPLALQARLADFVEQGLGHCAMEVSSHALDQNRVGGVQFDAAVLTNITRDHLDYHGTVEHYAAAKRRLFEVADGRRLILNRDDAHGAAWIGEWKATQADRLCVYGLDGEPVDALRHVLGHALRLHEAGLDLEVESHAGRGRIRSRLLGRFNAYNLLAALSVLLDAGVDLGQACAALSAARTVPGRIEGFRGPLAAPLAVVDYAHTPQALEQVLCALRAHVRGRLFCVFGCGGDRDRGKRPLMGAVASRLADVVIITDDNPRTEAPEAIVAAILDGVPASAGGRVQVEHDRAVAIRRAIAEAGAEDLVLVAGKGHETTQTYGAQVRPFSDRARVAELLGATL